MIQFDLPKQKSSIIKVIGVGGGGSNAVNFMHAQDITGVDFIICNTDAKAIEQSKVPNKIQLGPHLTQGLGAGANPEVGKKATEESLDEIKRILEVNTKMAFICVGMGGGTGTGGAPIIAETCRDLGILTVGIVTTPFGFEGPRRMLQAEEGIRQLKPFVDTLLVISNDKLRMQYGNLKMNEAFGKADNVLATAAKCITDIINSRGHIIVDFSDVCTVMKNGGVAILGKSEVGGENRAQLAIEEALSSPLLNDSEIKGAKWILININSAEGDYECTMDEMETINDYLRMQAGEETDVIVGMGYEPELGEKIGITIIATGFEHKDPFAQPTPTKKAIVKEEKIMMVLGETEKAIVLNETQEIVENTIVDELAPKISVPQEAVTMHVAQAELDLFHHEEQTMEVTSNEMQTLHFELSIDLPETEQKKEEQVVLPKTAEEALVQFEFNEQPTQPITQKFGGLHKPNNIYAIQENESAKENVETKKNLEEAKPNSVDAIPHLFNQEEEIKLAFHETPIAETPIQPVPVQSVFSQEDPYFDETEEQKRRAAERIQKLRNLSFNMNSNDPNNEFDSVPAYIRRNRELFGTSLETVENFYSKVTVGKDSNNQTQLSTINTFLDGKRPD